MLPVQPLDPQRPYAFLSEREPHLNVPGGVEAVDVNTVFLTATRCPIGCAMCDLHQFTLPDPLPGGAIERQIRFALDQLPPARWIKLYNSGNFFDPVSIAPAEYESIADLCRDHDRVIIENHPRFGASRHETFRDLIPGRLEIAVGLETVQPRWLSRLGKQMTRDEFDRYAAKLSMSDIDLRVFLIVGVPGISVSEAMRWARLSVRHAVASNARHISLIPARAGHGWNGQADRLPKLKLEDLRELFALALEDVAGQASLTVDMWDVHRDELAEAERDRLTRLNNAILAQDASLL